MAYLFEYMKYGLKEDLYMKRKLVFILIIILLSLSGCQSNVSTIDKSSPENNKAVVESISPSPPTESVPSISPTAQATQLPADVIATLFPEPIATSSPEPVITPKAEQEVEDQPTPEPTANPVPTPAETPASEGYMELSDVKMIPVDYSLDGNNVIVSDETIYELNTMFEPDELKSISEGVSSIYKYDIPDNIYLIVTGFSGVMPHGATCHLFIKGTIVTLPDIGGINDTSACLLPDKYLFIKSKYVYGKKLSLVDLNTFTYFLVNDIISKPTIESFEIQGNKLILKANDSTIFGTVDDEYETIEVNLDEI